MIIIDKNTIAEYLSNYLPNFLQQDIIDLVEIPPQDLNYSYAFPCFQLAKIKKKPPDQIAKELEKQLELPEYLEVIEADGPYLNFKIKPQPILEQIFTLKENYGRIYEELRKGQVPSSRIVIEYPSPNTNKPLHFGHIRNMLLGSSLSRCLKYKGDIVFDVNLNNERGIHICKSMYAYKNWGNNKEPDIKPDHFVGAFYVKYNEMEKKDSKIIKEVYELLRLWEENDAETRELWKKMNSWAYEGFKETYNTLRISFDKEYFESDIYWKGKEKVLKGLKSGIFSKTDDGAIIAHLKEKVNLPDKILMRKDGTSLYVTQDIYLAYQKKEDFDYDKSIYVVANEQDLYFKQLFAILDMIGFKEDKFHLSYGMVYLPEGKMKSREGTIVDADNIIEQIQDLAYKEVNKRYPELAENLKKERATAIGMAALVFFILKFNPKSDFVFNPRETISFEGETGPYIQYCYARIESIITKSKKKIDLNINWDLLNHEKELTLVKQLNYFPEILNSVRKNYSIHQIPQYLLTLCQAFNSFYSSCQVLSSDNELERARLLLIKCVQIVIKIGLQILGIDVLDQM
ncbi:MAG: arginine--tRNA ligase [Candidatus Lokiarchaeota archaeon]|nr:arginine--tRNA ligase [Candidatus Lokiarchaeota archaeon]